VSSGIGTRPITAQAAGAAGTKIMENRETESRKTLFFMVTAIYAIISREKEAQ
jgi:hypothetical protein